MLVCAEKGPLGVAGVDRSSRRILLHVHNHVLDVLATRCNLLLNLLSLVLLLQVLHGLVVLAPWGVIGELTLQELLFIFLAGFLLLLIREFLGERARLHGFQHAACRLRFLIGRFHIAVVNTALYDLGRVQSLLVNALSLSAILIILNNRLALSRFPRSATLSHSKPTERTLVCQISNVLGSYYSLSNSIIVQELIVSP